ncbi:hypothetical protein [Streptomyces sp. NPDC057375]|uniref:hypothetical protein n=1 Tax=Streptomyces sp. NPDC057375 TaxID=3346109 RepID=UPI00362570F1
MPQAPAPGEMAAAARRELHRLRHEYALGLTDERHARQPAETEARRLEARLKERGEYTEYLHPGPLPRLKVPTTT